MILSDVSNLKKRSVKLIDVECDSCNKHFNIKYVNYWRNGNRDGFYTCKTCKTKKTNLEKWGVENPSQVKEIKEKKEKTLIENWGVDHPSKSKEIKEKKRKTFQKNWGVDNPFQSDKVKEKIKSTNLDKFGVDNPSKSKKIKEKKRQTLIENWGVDHPLKSKEIKKRVKDSNLERWGTEWVLQNEEIKEKIKATNLDRFGFDNPVKSCVIKELLVKNNLEKWGTEYYYQTEDFKEKSKTTLLKRWGVESPIKSNIIKNKIKETNIKKWGESEYIKTNDFKEKTKETLLNKWESYSIQKSEIFRQNRFKITNDNNYIKYLENKISLFKCDCDKNHEFKISSDNYIQRKKSNIPLCTVCNPIGDSRSIKEKELYQFIKSIYDGEIIQSYRDGLEIDVYLPHLKLGFEFNGLYYHSDKYKDKWYHLNKTKYFEERGIRIIHIWEDHWVNKRHILESQIKNWLGFTPNKIFARKCKVVELDSVSQFLNDNHIQGVDYSKVKLGLLFEEELVSVMTFNKLEGRKPMREGEWNLSRFCNKKEHNVIGGASKLLKYFQNKYSVNRIISYSDRNWSLGNLYNNLGFNKINEGSPDYKYIVEGVRVHKSRFKKSKTGISESDLEIPRIWDCGKIKFEKINI